MCAGAPTRLGEPTMIIGSGERQFWGNLWVRPQRVFTAYASTCTGACNFGLGGNSIRSTERD